MALNDELAALAQARVNLDLKLGRRGTDVAAALARINALIARRVNQGASLEGALNTADEDLPQSYRAMMLLALRSGNLEVALSTSQRLAESVDQSSYVLRLS